MEPAELPLRRELIRGLVAAVAPTGLSSSVDVAPLLLSLATGSNAWRTDPLFTHLAGHHNLVPMLSDPTAPGRPFVLHATDEIVSEYAIEPYAYNATCT